MIKKSLSPFFILIIVVIVVAALGAFLFLRKNNPVKTNQKEVDLIVAKISQFYLLPDETPTLATVTDKNKLIGQVFFKKAENGDKVLIFPNAKKAIIYRASTNKIIEVGALDFGTTPKPTITQISQPLKILILNGTSTPGLAVNFEKDIKNQEITELEVINTDSAQKKDYKKSTIIDLTGKNNLKIKELADKFNLEILTKLPDGELESTAEAVIIIGK